ncbi:uncharacterized protein LOC134677685 [Cydia fagiglandana]|uniref:uncharacterized protein LOC134675903 n=1 Tax=Cydia fagiglandana TaxID=1458189 RepID=UPI002FEE26CB
MSENKHNMSSTQKKGLADIMASRTELRSGKFTSSFTHKKAQKEWEEITTILNAMPGATKTWQQWRKSWQDLLSKTKSKKGAINKDLHRTGGGRPLQALTEVETNIASLIDPRTISGHRDSQESEVTFDFDAHMISHMEAESEEEVTTVVQIVSDDDADAALPKPKEKVKQKKINLRTLMQQKLDLKKQAVEAEINFYREFLDNMRNQTAALEQIALSVRGRERSNLL